MWNTFLFSGRVAGECLEIEPNPIACCQRTETTGERSSATPGQMLLPCGRAVYEKRAAGEGREGEEGQPGETPIELWMWSRADSSQANTWGAGKDLCGPHVKARCCLRDLLGGSNLWGLQYHFMGSKRAVNNTLIYHWQQVSSFPVPWVGLCHHARALT